MASRNAPPGDNNYNGTYRSLHRSAAIASNTDHHPYPPVGAAATAMGKTADGLAREGPPPQKPPSKTQFDFHTRHLLHTLSQHLPGADPATTQYSALSEEDARLVRRTVGRAQRALERRQERKKKSKSTGTAADALEFYRHATVRARKMKGLDPDDEEDLEEHELLMSSDEEEEDDSDDDDDSDDEEDEEESSSEEEEGESDEESSDEEEEDNDDDNNKGGGEKKAAASAAAAAKGPDDGAGDDDDEVSAASFTSEEFLSAHNDLCEVCSGVGDDDAPLLCCDTCTLVFHQGCHRPVLVKEPPDNWSCAYCDDSGVTLHKRDSRERKRASKGVREMKKMMDDQAELDRAEAVAARAASRARAADSAAQTGAAAAGGGGGDDGGDGGIGEGDSSPSKTRGGGGSTRSPPKPAHNIRDPDTGRFMTLEKRILLYGPLGIPPQEAEDGTVGTEAEAGGEGGANDDDDDKDKGKGEGGGGEAKQVQSESSTKQNDLSDLTAEEIARLVSGGDDDGDDDKKEAASANAEEVEETKPTAAATSGAESKLRVDANQDTASGATTPTEFGTTTPKKTAGDDEQSQAQKNKQQLKGAELKLLLGAMSPEEVDISGPRARRQQRKAPALYDPGDMGGDMDWSSKKEAEARSGRRAAAPPGSKKRKRELLSDVLGKNKKGKSSGGGERNAKRRRKEEKKKAKRAAKRTKKKQQKRKKSKPKATKKGKGHLPPNEKEGANCVMCYDDDRVTVCVFCACRICFSKGDTEETLLCDGCDAEYHAYCLDPPLSSMPKDDDDWYCPACTNVELRKTLAAERRAKAKAAAASPKSTPKKAASKSPSKQQSPSSGSGRKRAGQQVSKAEAAKRARKSPTMEDDPTLISRSGRKVKRAQFHDELDAGVQHLATSLRSAGETGKLQLHTMSPEEAASIRAAANVASSTTAGARKGAARSPSAIAAASAGFPKATTVAYTSALRQGAVPPGMVGSKGLSVTLPRAPPTTNANGWGLGSPFPYEYVPPPQSDANKSARRKPGARECIQAAKRFGVQIIPEKTIGVLVDYCQRGKLEHLIKMREKLDDHSRFLEIQLAELEVLVKQKGESKVIVPPAAGVVFSGITSPRGGSISPPPPTPTPTPVTSRNTSTAASVSSLKSLTR